MKKKPEYDYMKGYIRDEHGRSVPNGTRECNGYRVPECHSYDDSEAFSQYVESLSPKLQELHKLNGSCQEELSSMGGLYTDLGVVEVACPEAIRSLDRTDLLKQLLRHDVLRGERVAKYMRHMLYFVNCYGDEYTRIYSTIHTPEDAIDEKYTYSDFYAREFKLYDEHNLLKYYNPSVHECPCGLSIRWMRHSKLESGCSFNQPIPYGTYRVSYSLSEIEDALCYAWTYGQGHMVTQEEAAFAEKEADGVCQLCGRPMGECGRLGAYPLAPDAVPYFVTKYDDEDKKLYQNRMVHMVCRDCIRIWYREYHRVLSTGCRDCPSVFLKVVAYFSGVEFANNGVLDDYPISDEEVSFLEYVSNFCKKVLADGVPSWYEDDYKQNKNHLRQWTHAHEVDSFFNSIFTRIMTEDERQFGDRKGRIRVKAFRDGHLPNQFSRKRLRKYEKLWWEGYSGKCSGLGLHNNHAFVLDLIVTKEKGSICPEKMIALDALNQEYLLKMKDLPFRIAIPEQHTSDKYLLWDSRPYSSLEAYAKDHPAEVKTMGEAMQYNRRLADEYRDKFLTILRKYRVQSKKESFWRTEEYCIEYILEQEKYLSLPVICYYVCAICNDEGFGSARCCSLERMCAIAGFPDMFEPSRPEGHFVRTEPII